MSPPSPRCWNQRPRCPRPSPRQRSRDMAAAHVAPGLLIASLHRGTTSGSLSGNPAIDSDETWTPEQKSTLQKPFRQPGPPPAVAAVQPREAAHQPPRPRLARARLASRIRRPARTAHRAGPGPRTRRHSESQRARDRGRVGRRVEPLPPAARPARRRRRCCRRARAASVAGDLGAGV